MCQELSGLSQKAATILFCAKKNECKCEYVTFDSKQMREQNRGQCAKIVFSSLKINV